MNQYKPNSGTLKPGSQQQKDFVEAAQWMHWALEGVFSSGAKFSEPPGLTPHNINSAIEIFELIAGDMSAREFEGARLVRALAKAFFILAYANGYGLLSGEALARAMEARRAAQSNLTCAFDSWGKATRLRLNGWDMVIEKFRVENPEDVPDDLLVNNVFGLENSTVEGLVAGWYLSSLEQSEAPQSDIESQARAAESESPAQPAIVAPVEAGPDVMEAHRVNFAAFLKTKALRKERTEALLGMVESHFDFGAPALLSVGSMKMLSECFDTYVALIDGDPDECVYSPDEVAELMGISEQQFRSRVENKTIPLPKGLVWKDDEKKPDVWYYSLLQVAAILKGFGKDLAKKDGTLAWYKLLLQYAEANVDPREIFA